MKKIIPNFKAITLRVLLTCCLGVFVMFFSSCSKEKKLDGTIWVGTYDESYSLVDYSTEYKYIIILTFTENSVNVNLNVTYISTGEDYYEKFTDSDSFTGTYTYKKNAIMLLIDGKTWRGTVAKKTDSMTLNVILEDLFGGESITFTKQ